MRARVTYFMIKLTVVHKTIEHPMTVRDANAESCSFNKQAGSRCCHTKPANVNTVGSHLMKSRTVWLHIAGASVCRQVEH